MVMVLGIIVDDAIIVIENCHRVPAAGPQRQRIRGPRYGRSDKADPQLGRHQRRRVPSIDPSAGRDGQVHARHPADLRAGAGRIRVFEAFVLLPSHYSEWTRRSNAHKRGRTAVLQEAPPHLRSPADPHAAAALLGHRMPCRRAGRRFDAHPASRGGFLFRRGIRRIQGNSSNSLKEPAWRSLTASPAPTRPRRSGFPTRTSRAWSPTSACCRATPSG